MLILKAFQGRQTRNRVGTEKEQSQGHLFSIPVLQSILTTLPELLPFPVLEAFNDVRNNQSLAHDNPVHRPAADRFRPVRLTKLHEAHCPPLGSDCPKTDRPTPRIVGVATLQAETIEISMPLSLQASCHFLKHKFG